MSQISALAAAAERLTGKSADGTYETLCDLFEEGVRGDTFNRWLAINGLPVSLAVDGEAPARGEMLMLVVANARIFGGGFKIAPAADLADGELDVVTFANMPLSRRMSILGRLLRGTHGGAPEVATRRGRRITLRFDAPPAYETDGEWHRAASAELAIDSVPSALRVLAPPA